MRRRLLLVILWTCCAAVAGAADEPRVVNGIVDLTGWDFASRGPVPIRGDYEFYWRKHLTSRELQRRPSDSVTTVEVPGAWNGTVIDNREIGGSGYATYRVNVLTARRDPLALEIADIGTSYRMIVDGKTLLEAGSPGKTKDTTTPRYSPTIVQFTPHGPRTEILFHVSNFHHRLGGFWLPIRIGAPDDLTRLRENRLARDLILFGAILIIGLYNFALFALRRESASSLFLGLFCVLLSVRQLMVGDRFMTSLIPDMPFDWYVRTEYLGWYLAIPMFCGFLRSLFPQEIHRYAARTIHSVFGLGAIVVLVTPPGIFTRTVPLFQALTLIGLVYGSVALVLAALHRREGSLILLFAYAFLFYTSVSDILVNAGITNNILLLDIGLFVFILCQSILISYRYTNSFKTIDAQRAKLEATNLKLRTQEKLRRDAEVRSRALNERLVQSEKMEAIGLLASGVAHDLGNVLSTTVTRPELAITRQAGLRAAAVIEDLSTLARGGVVRRDALNLNDVVMEYLGSVEHQLLQSEHPNLQVQTDLSDDLHEVDGSPVHLQMLLVNLVSNRVRDDGSKGTLYIATRNESVRARDLFYMKIDSGDYVVLSVEDEGSGIDPDDLDKAFEPFHSTWACHGLSVVRGVVLDHGGAIDVMSGRDVGTRFDIYLPKTSTGKPAPFNLPGHREAGIQSSV